MAAITMAAGAAAAVVQAQTSASTQDDARVIAADSIYRLAADSLAYPHQSIIVLLGDGAIRVESDGRTTRTIRQVVQILRQDAVAAYQEIALSSDPDRETLRTNWVRVVGRDGQVISAAPAQVQESDVSTPSFGPVSHRRHVVRLSLAGVAVGTIVDISTTVETKAPFRLGDFFESWRVATDIPVRRCRLILDVPSTLQLRIVEHNLTFHRRQSVSGSRTLYEWAAAELPWRTAERFEPPPDSNELTMAVHVASSATWSEIGRWYAGLARDRSQATTTLGDSVRRVVAKATTHDDSIGAVHRWIAQDVRYEAVPFGRDGYSPRAPDTVLSIGAGDSNDKATLLIAALSVLGVEAYPALIDVEGTPDLALPTSSAFDHVIVALPTAQGYRFVDPSSELVAFGRLPHNDAGRFALVVRRDGQADSVATPDEAVDADHGESYLSGHIDSAGIFSGRIEVRGYGLAEESMRWILKPGGDSGRAREFMRGILTPVFPATIDSAYKFSDKNLDAWAAVTARITNGRIMQRSGASYIMAINNVAGTWSALADQLQSELPRRTPIDVGAVTGLIGTKDSFEAILPEGWHARLPPDVVAESVFGSYKATYRQHGRLLSINHRLIKARGIVGKEHIQELIDWCRAVASDRASVITIDPE